MERLSGNMHKVQRFVRGSEGQSFGTGDIADETRIPRDDIYDILESMVRGGDGCVSVKRRGRWRGGNSYQFTGSSRKKCSGCVYAKSGSRGCVIELNLP